MKTNTIRFFGVLIVGFMLFLASCAEVKTTTELMTESTWVFSSVSNPNLDQETLLFFQAVFTGAKQDFATDGTYFTNYADSLFEDQNGTWELGADDVTLTLDKGTDDETTATIIEITENSFTWSGTDSLGTTTFIWTAEE